jgi:hypothetical protein
MVAYSTVLPCFLLREGGTERDREREKKKKVHVTVLVSPLKQILAIFALVIYKILETSPCNLSPNSARTPLFLYIYHFVTYYTL